MILASATQRAISRSLHAPLRPCRLKAAAAITRYNYSDDASSEAARPKAQSPFYHHTATDKQKLGDAETSLTDEPGRVYTFASTNILRQRLSYSDISTGNAKKKKRKLYNKKRQRDGISPEKNQTNDVSAVKDAYMIQSKEKQSKDEKRQVHIHTSAVKNVTESDWILVTNIPHMSKLSDLLPGLSKILEFELKKGIIDLDKLLINSKGKMVHIKDNQCYQALKDMDALDSLYTTKEISSESNLPLLQLDLDPGQSLPSQLIAEARLHVSYRARPQGWFLRFINRSVAHAVRCHINEADRHQKMIREQHDAERRDIVQQRKDWVEGLWRKVWHDSMAEQAAKINSMVLNDTKEERELMWGELDVVHEQDLDQRSDINFEQDQDTQKGNNENEPDDNNMEGSTDELPKDVVGDFYDEFSQTQPYPMDSTNMPSVESVFGLHRLKCGSNTVRVTAFSPLSSLESEMLSDLDLWDQHAFHLGNVLDLSDSVVRIETHGLNTTASNVKYILRAYNFKSIYPEPPGTVQKLPNSFVNLPKSIGWNVWQYKASKNESLPYGSVDLLVQGKMRDNRDRSNNSNTKIGPPTNHTFLVRFATSSDARMAVREMQGTMINERPLTLTQYPSASFS